MIIGGFLLISISVGGMIAWIFSTLFHYTTHGLSLVCGGFLIGLLILDIIPSAFQLYELFALLLGCVIGYCLFHLLHSLHHIQNTSVSLLTIAMILHTIPLSLTIGNLLGNAALTMPIIISLILHHIPEGFALSTALLSQGEKYWRLFCYFIIFSMFFSFFVWAGQYWSFTLKVQGILMGLSIGLIAITSLTELIMQPFRKTTAITALSSILFGFLMSYLFHLL
ncbi:zinc transporter family protein [Lysinibacillus piscis]|uniref:zinc transporter family protein n=1 Tax=Lysinibacillus piscis TaxID=2518931 RepID=UPI0022315D5A|nr:zinc transporter family protein [Lysinibacillus sp. KH24]